MKLRVVLATTCALVVLCGWNGGTTDRPVARLNFRYLFLPDQSYEDLWEEVEDYLKERLPKSALEIVDQIHAKATAEGNQPQRIRSLALRVSLRAETTEGGDSILYTELRDEMQASNGVPRAVLNSMLGEFLWSYYQSHRWQVISRTATESSAPEDFRTWDPQRYFDSARAFYEASLSPADTLQATAVRSYKDMLAIAENSDRFRPSLYDLLAHRALVFLANDETGLPRPTGEFVLDDSRGFLPSREFADALFISSDSTSQKLATMQLLQHLTRLHLEEKDPAALVDIDLIRLGYVKTTTTVDGADSLYGEALKNLADRHQGNEIAATVLHRLAEHIRARNDNARAMGICDQVIHDHPQSIGATNCRVLKSEILQRELSVTAERTTRPDFPFLLNVQWRNVEAIHIRVIRLESNTTEVRDHGMIYHFDEDRLEELLDTRPVYESAINLPKPRVENHTRQSAAFRIPGLGYGVYVILASPDKDFAMEENVISYAVNTVTDIAVVYQPMPSGLLRVRASHAVSGAPIDGVTVQVWGSQYNRDEKRYDWVNVETSTSDATGMVPITIPRSVYYQTGLILTKGNDRLVVMDLTPTHGETHYPYPRRTLIFTDRSIYRPGQVVYFKGIYFEKSRDEKHANVLPGRSVTVEFKDVNAQTTTRQKFVTNTFGSFHGSFTVPIGTLTGRMKLETPDGFREIRVEEYKRPRFETTFKPTTGTLRLGETVRVKGIAAAYAGSVVNGASVSYRVVRTVRWRHQRGWWDPEPASGSKEIAHGTTTTDATGVFEIPFTAEPDRTFPRHQLPIFTYSVTADVTDINGETRSALTMVSAGYTSTVLSISSTDQIETGREGKLRLRADNLNGQPVAASGRLLVNRIAPPSRLNRQRIMPRPTLFAMSAREFIDSFPLDAYDVDSSNHAVWRTERTVMEQPFRTDSSGVDSVAFARLEPGYYRVVAEGVETSGDTVRDAKMIVVYDRSSTRPLSPEPLTQVNLKTSGEPGDTAEILVGSGFVDGSLLYQVEHDGKVITEEIISLANAQKLLKIPLIEKYRGGITINLLLNHDHRTYTRTIPIEVTWSSRVLTIETATFRDKLMPGAAEEWRLTVKGAKGESVPAEMVASLYDASLDAIYRNNWEKVTWPVRLYDSRFRESTTGVTTQRNWERGWNIHPASRRYQSYDRLNVRMSRFVFARAILSSGSENPLDPAGDIDVVSSGFGAEYGDAVSGYVSIGATVSEPAALKAHSPPPRAGLPHNDVDHRQPAEVPGVQIRSNLNETAFFMPELRTNDKGEVVLTFTMPEALTRWRLMGFAHTTDMKSGSIDRSVVTQKELMIIPNLPRFFREGDSITFAVKISNLAAKDATGKARLTILDASTMRPIDSAYGLISGEQTFAASAGRSTHAEWRLKVPGGPGMVLYRVTATSGNFSDGEEGPIPVLPNRMLVTESLPLTIRGNESRTYTMPKLVSSGNGSTTLSNHKLTLEMTSNPAWYAVQALPYLMEFPYECAEQTFNRFYANAIASHIANSNPTIRRVFESWKGTDALVSNLEKNQELKGLLLQETPWVMDGKDETQQKQRLALLFDINRMSGESSLTLRKLGEMQNSNGGWPWFSGGHPDAWITQYIVAGIGHLHELGVDARKLAPLTQRGVAFIDEEMNRRYHRLTESQGFQEDADNIDQMEISYLYARSFFPTFEIDSRHRESFSYWKEQAATYWSTKGLMAQGMIALALHRFDDATTPAAIINSLRERALHSEEMGMYWNITSGWFWYQAPVETQAILIEAFDVVASDREERDSLRPWLISGLLPNWRSTREKEIDEMKLWLLKQKQVQNWRTTKATADACYALLRRGGDVLASDSLVEVTVGNRRFDPTSQDASSPEDGTGYFKTSWSGSEITPSMGNITATKHDAGIAWGALYWQYFEQLDRITPHESPLVISKSMFRQTNTDRGTRLVPLDQSMVLHVGDLVVVRLEVRSDRDMEYIHVKDMRGAGLEPVQQLSGYHWQGGLGYYQATKDASTNFFIGWLPKGVRVFEYQLRVSHKGTFSNGISTVQSMYAPEFASHTAGTVVRVE